MQNSVTVKVSRDLDNNIRKLKADIEKQVGFKISYPQASIAYSKMQTYKNFKVRIKGKGVVEISQ